MFELVGKTLVIVQNEQPIDDTEWDAMCEAEANWPYFGLIIWTQKQMPNASQRTRIRKALEKRGKKFRASLLTSSPLARTIISIFSIFVGDQLKGFAPEDLPGALKHAEVPLEEHSNVIATLHRLRAELRPITSASPSARPPAL
jgi:hypothetical protein